MRLGTRGVKRNYEFNTNNWRSIHSRNQKNNRKEYMLVFSCTSDDIEELVPVQAGMTNIVLSFKLNGGKYVYRHPGLGSDALVELGRETIMQKIVEDAGIDATLIAMDVDEGWRIGKFVEHYDFDYNNCNSETNLSKPFGKSVNNI